MLPLQPVSNLAWITVNLQPCELAKAGNQIVQIWLSNRDSQRYPRLEAAATVYCFSESSSQQAVLYSKCQLHDVARFKFEDKVPVLHRCLSDFVPQAMA